MPTAPPARPHVPRARYRLLSRAALVAWAIAWLQGGAAFGLA